MPARIDDVARAAKVSTKTVSRVLNEERGVREATRQRVLEAVKALNYRPLASARSLAANRSFMVALFYDNLSPSYIMEVQAGVMAACEAQRYSMMVQPISSNDPSFVEHAMGIIARHRPDGVVLTPPVTDHSVLLDHLHDAKIPFASIAPRQPEATIGATFKEREAAAAIVAHLVTLGHRKIAHIAGDPRHGAGVWRLAGYRDSLKQAGIRERPEYIAQGQFSFDSGVSAARQLFTLSDRPTAIFAADDDMAVGVIWAASQAGIAVPGDISVCGFDDTNIATQVWPPLTTVHQPVRVMGQQATNQLLKLIRGHASDATMVEADYQMCLRASTGPVPASPKPRRRSTR